MAKDEMGPPRFGQFGWQHSTPPSNVFFEKNVNRQEPMMEVPKRKRTAAKTAAATCSKSLSQTKDETSVDLAKRLGKTPERLNAEASLSSLFVNAATSREFSLGNFAGLELVEVGVVLREKIKQVQSGDLSEVEAMMTAQAQTLDTIFNVLARRAAANLGQNSSAADVYLKNAFKAQAQCRATLQSLAEIKNPRPVAFVKQANIAHGPQQINNEIPAGQASLARAREEKPIQSNELLEVQDGERLDPGTASTASGIDTHMETVGKIHRPPE